MIFTTKNISKALNIEEGEGKLVYLLLLQSVFIGIFTGAFENSVSSLFLQHFPGEMLSNAYAISGITGVILTAIYSFFHAKISFKKLAIGNLFIILALTCLSWFGFSIISSKWHIFAVMVIMGPLTILSSIGFWGTVGRLFSLRQGKRLFGLVDSGLIIGIILSSYSIPIFLAMGLKTKDLLLLSTISISLALMLQFLISFKAKELETAPTTKKEYKTENSNFFDLFKNRFTLLLSLYAAVSMLIAFFIAYSFLGAIQIKYPEEAEKTRFLGLFTGTMMIFTLILKTVVYSKFMKTYGLKASLLLSPLVLTIFSVVAMVVGTIFGYEAEAGGFVFFFLLLTLSRLFSISLKSSMEGPSFKLLYQTIDKSKRHQVQAQVDGSINEAAATSSGIILFLLGLIPFFALIHYTYVLVAVVVIWIILSIKLYKAYKNNLDDSLNTLKTSEHIENNTLTGTFVLSNNNTSQNLIRLNIFKKTNPLSYEKHLPSLLTHNDNTIKNYALEAIDESSSYDMIDVIREKYTDESKNILNKITLELSESQLTERILQLSKSRNAHDREVAAKLIGDNRNDDNIPVLTTLLRDFDYQVKLMSLKSASKLQNSKLSTLLIDFLLKDDYAAYASEALISIGEPAVEYLEQAFNKSGLEARQINRIIDIIGKIGGEKAQKSLITKIVFFQSGISTHAAQALKKLQYRVNEQSYYLAYQALSRIISITAWNIAARASLKDSGLQMLLNTINEELDSNYNEVFTILSLLYDPTTIDHVQKSIMEDNSESAGFAIELLDLIVADDIKPTLFALLEDNTDIVKVRQLQYFFPVDKWSIEQLLYDIINRDYNSIGIWTKACAMNAILNNNKIKIKDDIVAQVFNSDPLLSKLSACILSKKDQTQFELLLKRLSHDQRITLRTDVNYYKTKNQIKIFESFNRLKNIDEFKSLSNQSIYEICKKSEIVEMQEGELHIIDNEENQKYIFLITNGELELKHSDNETLQLNKGNYYGGFFTKFATYTIQAKSTETTLIKIKHSDFDHLLFDFEDISNSFYKSTKEYLNI